MPLRNLHIVLVFIALWSFTDLSAQSTTDSLSTADPASGNLPSSNILFRPQIEVGLGVLSYFGDVGHLNGSGRRSSLNWGYSIAIKNRLSNAFGLDIFAMFGKVSGEEDLSGGDANFETPIRMGGLSINYNFNSLLPEKRNITPYISLGIASFEFDPKGDKYDAQGNKYYYWSDGTIRNKSQTTAKANDAIILRRDGVYESDLREISADNHERYPLRAFSIPVGAGVGIHINNSFTVSMGATFHFALSDNIDNINSDAQRYATTKKGNDFLLFSTVGIAYDLHYRKNKSSKYPNLDNTNFPDLRTEDEDKDAVADIIDWCPFTPSGVQIDQYGCPIDTDQDGVADYADIEPNSGQTAVVNSEGVSLTDQDFEAMYHTYMDTLGNLQYDKSQTYTADINLPRITNSHKTYRIVFENTASMDKQTISKLLSLHDLKSEDSEAGTEYYIGDFTTLTDVLARQSQLQNTDFNTKVVYDKYGDAMITDDKELAMLINAVNPIPTDYHGVTFRIQIGAYRYKLSNNVFMGVPGLLPIDGTDGLTRYFSGHYTNMEEAAENKIELLLKGYDGAFIKAYKDHKRITLESAGATVMGEEDMSAPIATESINKDLVKFTIQLGSFNGRVPADVLSRYMTLGDVRPLRGSNGTTKYVYGVFNSLEIANAKRREINTQGFSDAFVVGEFDSRVIDAAEAKKIKSN